MRDYLLALNHLFKFSNTVIMPLLKSVGLELVTVITVSANRIGSDLFLTKFGKSFIQRRNCKDPVWILVGCHALFYPSCKLSDD
jgi:hypothetical protein